MFAFIWMYRYASMYIMDYCKRLKYLVSNFSYSSPNWYLSWNIESSQYSFHESLLPVFLVVTIWQFLDLNTHLTSRRNKPLVSLVPNIANTILNYKSIFYFVHEMILKKLQNNLHNIPIIPTYHSIINPSGSLASLNCFNHRNVSQSSEMALCIN